MDELYDSFAAAASRDEALEPERRELLVHVIGAAAARRRRRRVAAQGAGAVGAVAVVVAGVSLTAGQWGWGDRAAQPGDATAASHLSAPASPSPSASPSMDGDDAPWELAGEGWFVAAFGSEEAPEFALIGPDGAAYDEVTSGDVLERGRGALEVTFTETETGDGVEVHLWADGVEAPSPACVTGDDYGNALLTLDERAVVCFDSVGQNSTMVVLAPVGGGTPAEQLAVFEFPASSYARLGWTSETTLLFGRELEKGYRYFSFDIETGDVTDVFLPGDLDGWVPRYDLATDTYTLVKPGAVEFYDGAGELIVEVRCDGAAGPEPVVVLSGGNAFTQCASTSARATAPAVVDLTTGTLHMVTVPGSVTGEFVSAWTYPAFAGSAG